MVNMVFCCAPGCKSRGGKLKRGSQTFHRFPTQPLLRKKWVEAVARAGWSPNNSRLCSLHFRDADYDHASELKRSRLKYGAVPSVFERAWSDIQEGEDDLRLEGSEEADDIDDSDDNGELPPPISDPLTLLRSAPSRAEDSEDNLDMRVYQEGPLGIEEEIEGRVKEEVETVQDRMVRVNRKRKRRLFDKERGANIRRKFLLLAKKVERLEAELFESRSENERLRDRITALNKDTRATSPIPMPIIARSCRSTQTRAIDFSRMNDGRLIEDSEDDATEYRPPVPVKKRRRPSPSPQKVTQRLVYLARREASEAEGNIRESKSRKFMVSAKSKEAMKCTAMATPTGTPVFRAQKSPSPPLSGEANVPIEKQVTLLDSSQNSMRRSAPAKLDGSRGRLVSILKVEEQDHTTSPATDDIILSAAEGKEMATNGSYVKIERQA